MDGLEFLEKIMRLRPMPVIMVSTLTSRGADATIKRSKSCLGLCRQAVTGEHAFLRRAARQGEDGRHYARACAYGVLLRPRRAIRSRATSPTVAWWRSALPPGGVEALIAILTSSRNNCPPTGSRCTCRRLHRDLRAAARPLCAPEGDRGHRRRSFIVPGQIFLAPGGAAHLEVMGASMLRCHLRTGDLVGGHRTSVDVLFNSVAKTCRAAAMGVILTGMGRDGAAGLLEMRRAGAQTIGQNESTCVVYGMQGGVRWDRRQAGHPNKIGAEIVSARSANT